MRIEQTGLFSKYKLTLEGGETIEVVQEDGHRLSLSYGDNGAPGPENWTDAELIIIRNK